MSLRTIIRFDRKLIIILWAYICLFFIASIILIASFLGHPSQNTLINSLPLHLYHKLSISDRNIFDSFGWPHKPLENRFNCAWMGENSLEYITSGWTKSIHRITLQKKIFALKAVNEDGESMIRCLANDTWHNCYDLASSRLIKEFILFQELRHPHIIEGYGLCFHKGKILMVTEFCEPLETIKFLTMPFCHRIKVALDLAHLGNFLSKSPLGSLSLNDFRREQFLLCNETLKLTDLDDVGTVEPSCDEKGRCVAGICHKAFCNGYNEEHNVKIMFQEVFQYLLAFDTPDSLRQPLSQLLSKNKRNNSLQVLELLTIFVNICTTNKFC